MCVGECLSSVCVWCLCVGVLCVAMGGRCQAVFIEGVCSGGFNLFMGCCVCCCMYPEGDVGRLWGRCVLYKQKVSGGRM